MTDYVELYAKKLRKDNTIFAEQKRFIEAQLQGSASLFRKMCRGRDFKACAREYLRGVGLLK